MAQRGRCIHGLAFYDLDDGKRVWTCDWCADQHDLPYAMRQRKNGRRYNPSDHLPKGKQSTRKDDDE